MLTDVAGLYADWPDTSEVSPRSAPASWHDCCPAWPAGMVPKMEACLRAVEAGVPAATVLDGRELHALLLEIFTTEGIGTMVLTGRSGRDERRTTCWPTALVPGDDGQLRAAAAGAGQRPRASGSPTSTVNEYLDFIGGIAVSSLGHAHPALIAAVTDQVGRLAHTSNLFLHEPGVALAEKLHSLLTGAGRRGSSSPTTAPRPTSARSRSADCTAGSSTRPVAG